MAFKKSIIILSLLGFMFLSSAARAGQWQDLTYTAANTTTSIPITDASWTALGSGMNNSVYALAVDASGTLYAGGIFTTAGGAPANYLAKWDGTSWSALGSGIWSDNHTYVAALAVSASGTLYAGGNFIAAGGKTAHNIAKWDGTRWSALGSGVNGTVFALAVDASGTLYAGGSFTTAGGKAALNIAKWDGASWSALGSWVYGSVNAITVDASGNLYAVGPGGGSVTYIAKWDGTSWSALGSGMGYKYPIVYALAADASGNLYAGGSFTTAGGVDAGNIAQWDGTSWSALGAGLAGIFFAPVYALAVDASGNLYAGGTFVRYLTKWDGTSWSTLGSGVNGTVSALAVDGSGNLYAGGGFTTAGGKAAQYIARCNLIDINPTTTTTTTKPPETCTVEFFPRSLSKVGDTVMQLQAIIIRGNENAAFSKATKINWGTYSVQTMLQAAINKRIIVALVLVNGNNQNAGDIYEVTVDSCTGEVPVKMF